MRNISCKSLLLVMVKKTGIKYSLNCLPYNYLWSGIVTNKSTHTIASSSIVSNQTGLKNYTDLKIKLYQSNYIILFLYLPSVSGHDWPKLTNIFPLIHWLNGLNLMCCDEQCKYLLQVIWDLELRDLVQTKIFVSGFYTKILHIDGYHI